LFAEHFVFSVVLNCIGLIIGLALEDERVWAHTLSLTLPYSPLHLT